jgi:hypothetical protein
VVTEVLFELGFEGLRQSARPRQESSKGLALLGYLLLGVALGALSAWLLPSRLSSSDLISGSSLVLNPMLSGFAMHYLGVWRRSYGKSTTRLATFSGGATFAFGVAAARLLVLTA